MTNSPLVTYTKISPNRTSPRTHTIDTITIHCVVGQWTAKQGCDYFANADVGASPNYIVGKDGSVGLCVEEGDRSWCSSNAANDHRAITIEVASDTTSPYAVTDAAYNALVDLLEDICRRNGIPRLLWQANKSLIGQVDKQNMTVHRWFANKACPGDYLYNRHGEIAAEVTSRLSLNKKMEDDDMDFSKWTDADFVNFASKMQAALGKQAISSALSKEYAEAKKEGITDGTNPCAFATRAQAAVMDLRTMKGNS